MKDNSLRFLATLFASFLGCATSPRPIEGKAPINYGTITVNDPAGGWNLDVSSGETPYLSTTSEDDHQVIGFALQRSGEPPAGEYSEVKISFYPSRFFSNGSWAYQLTGCGREMSLGQSEQGNQEHPGKIDNVSFLVPNGDDRHVCLIHVRMYVPLLR
jgi:hypothetical protein